MRRHGFTLVEVLVALVIASMAATLAHRIFTASADGAKALVEARGRLDRHRNVHRFLSAAFLSLDVGAAGAGSFEGHAQAMRFSTWLETADGGFKRERVGVALRHGRLIADVSSRPLVLADSVVAVRFDYLLEYGANESWATEWISPLSAPLAVRIRLQRATTDTTLYLIKARG